jgi:glucose-1-phosphate thymidylyltransferase
VNLDGEADFVVGGRTIVGLGPQTALSLAAMTQRKGIILAGGAGTRLAPLTQVISKQLLPVYDKPMIYYPLSLLMLSGIRDIAIISDPENLPLIRKVLGNGHDLGLQFEYLIQPQPRGLAEAFIIAADFLAGAPVCMVLGDNILFGHQLTELLQAACVRTRATVFGVRVRNPRDYGVLGFDSEGRPITIEEKPIAPRSNVAVPGVYYFDEKAAAYARDVVPSSRGELEITSVISRYIAESRLDVEILGRGFAWLDAGSHGSLLEASNFVETIERRQSQKIACIEEIAFNLGWISADMLRGFAARYDKSTYGEYLASLLDAPTIGLTKARSDGEIR